MRRSWRSKPTRFWNVRELCAIVGVAERTLRACCDAFLGISPRRYLQLRRLKLVRAAMLRGDPATVRVGDVARRHGFAAVQPFRCGIPAGIRRKSIDDIGASEKYRPVTSNFRKLHSVTVFRQFNVEGSAGEPREVPCGSISIASET